jgi:MFS family permease
MRELPVVDVVTSHPDVVTAVPWYRTVTVAQRRALIAAALGWMLDSMDVMLYSLVLSYMMRDLAMEKSTAGLLGSISLAASSIGGIGFGVIADRWGRKPALMGSILMYSIFTAACGLSQTVTQLAILRVFLGLGMGGEWATGAALVSETWPSEHRGKALGLVQSSWAIGYALAAVVTAIVLPRWGWRAVFFVGVLPAFVSIWILRRVEEPEIWQRNRSTVQTQPRLARIFSGQLGRLTLALTLLQSGTMFGYWGLNLWIPAYLSLPATEGGVGLSTMSMSGFILAMQVGTWLGYVSFGFICDRFGRKKTYVAFLVAAAVLVPIYAVVRMPIVLLMLGPFVAFFGTGHFTGMGPVTAEIFPTQIRATAQGFIYNVGRLGGAVAPLLVGALAQTHGFGTAFSVTAVALTFSASMWFFIPETKGRELA